MSDGRNLTKVLGGIVAALLLMGPVAKADEKKEEALKAAPANTTTSDTASQVAAAPLSATQNSTATSDTTAESPKLTDKIIANYWGVYAGPSLRGVTEFTPETDGSQSTQQNLDGAVTLGYRLSKISSISAGINFTYEPMAQNITMNDPALKFVRKEVINSNGLKLTLEGRAYAPTSDASQAAELITQLRAIQNLSYDIPNTAFSLGSYSYYRYNFYRTSATGSYDNKFYLAPYANYQITEKVAATFWCDLIQATNKRREARLNLTNSTPAAQVGINWDINSHLSLNPFINVVPGYLNTASSSAGLIISAVAL